MCLAHGHIEARFYPLGMVSDEAALCARRVNNSHVTTATLLQQAVSGVLSKKGNALFQATIKKILET